MGGWLVRELRGSASELHGAELAAESPPGEAVVWVLEVDRPALVLGSAQRADDVDHEVAAREGVEVARRRSGGGAVLLAPGEAVWVDFLVPRGHPLWDDDVSRSSLWLGSIWAAALAQLGVRGAQVHSGGMQCALAGSAVCFAGLGPGEVTSDGAKVVGISQRRTRVGARFQSVLLSRWDARGYERLLAPGLGRAGIPQGALDDLSVLAVDAPADLVVSRLVSSL